MAREQQFINGDWIDGRGPEQVSIDPGNGLTVWRGASASTTQVTDAVLAANAASASWAATPVSERQVVLERFVKLLDSRGDDLADAISSEVGKPRWEGRAEVGSVRGKLAATIESFKERARHKTTPAGAAQSTTFYRPLGTVAILGPFNFPAHMPNGHIMPALIAGNTVVFKPSELTPLVGETYTDIWHEAGLPPGVLNLVHGGAATGAKLAEDVGVTGVFFNGSRETGVAISRSVADRPEKLLVLEMGGNNALVVWDYEDIRAAVHLALQSCYVTSGQRCTAARRLVVPEGDSQFLSALADAVKNIQIGPQDADPAPFMGPVISTASAEKLLGQQAKLIESGAKTLVAMERDPLGPRFLRPGLIDVTGLDFAPDEEIFGPLLQVHRVGSFDAALRVVNTTRFGLAAGLVSRDRDLFERFMAHTRAGIVNWNQQLTGASGQAPFGGLGESGNHRPSGSAAVDYCSDAVGGLQSESVVLPGQLQPGLRL